MIMAIVSGRLPMEGISLQAVLFRAILAVQVATKAESTQQDWILPVNVLWQKVFGGSGNDVGSSIIPATDGGYILAGTQIQRILVRTSGMEMKTSLS